MSWYIHTALVTGSGSFPADMLRYDACFPAGEETVLAIGSAYPEIRDTRIPLRIAKYSHHKNPDGAWTVDRWASFGWMISDTEVKKIRS